MQLVPHTPPAAPRCVCVYGNLPACLLGLQLANEFLDAMGTGPRERPAWAALRELIAGLDEWQAALDPSAAGAAGTPLGSHAGGGGLFASPAPRQGADGRLASPNNADFTFALPSGLRSGALPS